MCEKAAASLILSCGAIVHRQPVASMPRRPLAPSNLFWQLNWGFRELCCPTLFSSFEAENHRASAPTHLPLLFFIFSVHCIWVKNVACFNSSLFHSLHFVHSVFPSYVLLAHPLVSFSFCSVLHQVFGRSMHFGSSGCW